MRSLLLLSALLAALLSQTQAFFCSKGDYHFKIGVIWDGIKEPDLDHTDSPRWEEAQFVNRWPDSFQEVFPGKKKVKAGRKDLIRYNNDMKYCYRSYWEPITVKGSKDLSYVYNATVRKQLKDSAVLVGPYMRAIASFATENSIPYFVTAPVPLGADPLKSVVPGASPLVYMWPSWTDVARAVGAFLEGENHKKVLVLYTGGSRTAFDVSQLVHTTISSMASVQFVGITVIRYPDIPEKDDPTKAQTAELDAVQKLINDKQVDTVVAFFDNEDPMWLLQQFFTEARNMDRADLTWLFYDQTFFVNSKMTQLEKVRVLRSPIYTILPSTNPGFNCFSFYDNTNKMGAYDAMLFLKPIIDQTLEKDIDPNDFTTEKFKQIVMGKVATEKINGPLPYSKFKKVQIEQTPVHLGWNMSFAETRTRNHFEMQIRHLLPDATVYGKAGSTCGTITSIWFSDRIPVGVGIEDNYVRVNELVGREQATTVVAVEDFPMVGLRYDPYNTLKGNDRFEGVSVDIFREAAKVMATRGKRFKYDIRLQEDGLYGRKDESTGQWSGVFAQIQNKKARVAIGHIAKTTQRMRDFTFTQTFGFIGLTYLVKRQPLENDWFPFLRPFQPQVWAGLMFTMIMSGIFVHLLEWWNPHRQPKPDPSEPSLLSLKESGWYSYMTITAMGAPYAPTNHSTRTFSVFYWFFALLVVACYTGNLASFLTESRYRKRPSSLMDLLHQSELIYGTLSESSNADFFKNSPNIDFRQMYKMMRENEGFVTNYKEGIERVKNSSYALIGDNILLDYYAGTDEECELEAYPSGASDLTEVAFVVDPNWPLLPDFSAAIAQLREDGTLREIYQRWLKNAKKCKSEAEEEDNDTAHLTFRSFHGLYLLLFIASVISMVALWLKMRRLKRRSMKEKEKEAAENEVDLQVIDNKYALDNDPSDVNENDVKDTDVSDVKDTNVNNVNETKADVNHYDDVSMQSGFMESTKL